MRMRLGKTYNPSSKMSAQNYWHYTIGYEKLSQDEFIAILCHHGVRVLIDSRWSPFSYRPEFRGSILARACATVGIEYRHLPELGIPKDVRQSNDGQSAFAWYSKHLNGINFDDLSSVLLTPKSAIMCYEADPSQCHRTILAKKLQNTYCRQWRELRAVPSDSQDLPHTSTGLGKA